MPTLIDLLVAALVGLGWQMLDIPHSNTWSVIVWGLAAVIAFRRSIESAIPFLASPITKRKSHPKSVIHALSDERSLNDVVYWMVTESAWGKYAGHKKALSLDDVNKHSLHLATLEISRTLEEGRIAIRARRSEDIDYVTLPIDFWKSAYLSVKDDKLQIWKVYIETKEGLSDAAKEKIHKLDYVSLRAKWAEVQAIWDDPEYLTAIARKK